MKCNNQHMQALDERIVSDSADKAQAIAISSVANRKCGFPGCDSELTITHLIGTEEISLHAEYTIYGYMCRCGERVEVERVEINRSITPPASKTVSCSKGHSRTILNREFPYLQKWMEKTN